MDLKVACSLFFVLLAFASASRPINKLSVLSPPTWSSAPSLIQSREKTKFEGGEHYEIANAQKYPIKVPTQVPARENDTAAFEALTPNNLPLFSSKKNIAWTYPQIVAAAGDFFGPSSIGDIICKKTRTSDIEQERVFVRMSDLLRNTDDPTSHQNFITNQQNTIRETQAEITSGIQNAQSAGNATEERLLREELTVAGSKTFYIKDRPRDKEKQKKTLLKPEAEDPIMGLAFNDDHFVNCSHRAYHIGHHVAMRQAILAGAQYATARTPGKIINPEKCMGLTADSVKKAYVAPFLNHELAKKNYLMALAKDAFAGHFLTDSFSSGHMRTPRGSLRDDGVCSTVIVKLAPEAGLSTNMMHDEDNLNGLLVRNALGDIWWSFGDKRFYDNVNAMNRAQAARAVAISRDELWAAFVRGAQKGVENKVHLDCSGDNTKFKHSYNLFKLYFSAEVSWMMDLKEQGKYLGAMRVLPTTNGLTLRQQLENTCPKITKKKGALAGGKKSQLYIRRSGTGHARPPLANALGFPTTQSLRASAELFPEFSTLADTDFNTPPTYPSSTDSHEPFDRSFNEYAIECQYDPMVADHCCKPGAKWSGLTPDFEAGSRNKPTPTMGNASSLSTRYSVSTYENQCLNGGRETEWKIDAESGLRRKKYEDIFPRPSNPGP